MILVDSSVWIDYFRGTATPETDFLDARLGVEVIAVGDIILTEVLQGFTDNSAFETASVMMQSLEQIEIVGVPLAVEAARNYRRLRIRGVTIRKTIDTLIATRCIVDRLPLLFADRDFMPFVTHLGLVSALDAR